MPLLIDESYNANPASMRAALALLGQAPVGPRGRRIAVLGDMLELGRRAPALHRGLAERRSSTMPSIWCSARAALMRGAVGGSSLGAAGRLCRDVRGARSQRARRVARGRRGDGQGLARLEDGPDRQGADPPVCVARRPRSGVRRRVDPMLYWLADLSSTLSFFNVFRYLTVRTGGAMMTALVFVFLFGPVDHRSSARAAGQGPADPRRRAAVAPPRPRPARRPWAG